MKNIIIQGAGFADNFGDVLFYDMFIREAVKQNTNVKLMSASELVTRHLPIKIDEQNKFSKVIESNGIVFVGGGYMGEQPYKSKLKRYRWGLATIKNILYVGILGVIFRKPIIVIGVGSGNVTNPLTRGVIKMICNNSNKSIARDLESYEALKNMGVKEEKLEVTTDTVLALHEYYKLETCKSEEKFVALHLSESPELCEKTKIVLEDTIDFLERNKEYKLMAITDHNGGGQDRAIDYLKRNLNENVVICRYETPEQLINVLNSTTIIITNKLHVGIVGAVLSKSVISLPNHPKVKNFFNQIGESKRCIDFKKINKKDVYNLLEEYKDSDINIPNELIEKSYSNIEYFRDFISNI